MLVQGEPPADRFFFFFRSDMGFFYGRKSRASGVSYCNPLKDSPMKWICCSPIKWLALYHFIGTTAVICIHHIHDMVGFHFIIFRLGCPKTFYKLPPVWRMSESREEHSFYNPPFYTEELERIWHNSFYKFGIFNYRPCIKFAESFRDAFFHRKFTRDLIL